MHLPLSALLGMEHFKYIAFWSGWLLPRSQSMVLAWRRELWVAELSEGRGTRQRSVQGRAPSFRQDRPTTVPEMAHPQ